MAEVQLKITDKMQRQFNVKTNYTFIAVYFSNRQWRKCQCFCRWIAVHALRQRQNRDLHRFGHRHQFRNCWKYQQLLLVYYILYQLRSRVSDIIPTPIILMEILHWPHGRRTCRGCITCCWLVRMMNDDEWNRNRFDGVNDFGWSCTPSGATDNVHTFWHDGESRWK